MEEWGGTGTLMLLNILFGDMQMLINTGSSHTLIWLSHLRLMTPSPISSKYVHDTI